MLVVDITVCPQGVHLGLVCTDNHIVGFSQVLSRTLLDDGDMRLVKHRTIFENFRMSTDVYTLKEPGTYGNSHDDHGPSVEMGVLRRKFDDPPDELVVDPICLQGCFGLAVYVLDCDVLVRWLVDIWRMGKTHDGVAWIGGHVRP